MDELLLKRVGDLSSGHTVRRYDHELGKLRTLILEMGEHVSEQVHAAVSALLDGDDCLAFRVLDREPQIDYLALDADEEVFQIITRRQPTALDLRIVLALSKIAAEAERAGDKAARIARRSLELGSISALLPTSLPEVLRLSLQQLEERACCMFERSLDAVSSFSVEQALTIFEDEPALYDASYTVRQQLESPPADDTAALLPAQLAYLLTIGHALERIGNHAANIAEQVIYVAEGKDIRFRNREILIETLRHGTGERSSEF